MTTALPTEGFCKLDTVLAVIPVSRSSWYEGVKNGIYPKPVKIGRSSAWRVGEIRAVIARIEQQNQYSTSEQDKK